MGPVLFVMAIMGCGEGDAACRQVRLAETRYPTEAACMAATTSELARADDLLFPSVVAQCRPANQTTRPLPASEVRLPDPDRVSPFPAVRVARGAGRFGRSS
jgi:hypothetical protein